VEQAVSLAMALLLHQPQEAVLAFELVLEAREDKLRLGLEPQNSPVETEEPETPLLLPAVLEAGDVLVQRGMAPEAPVRPPSIPTVKQEARVTPLVGMVALVVNIPVAQILHQLLLVVEAADREVLLPVLSLGQPEEWF
jgi:hypothetical protein